MACRLCYLTKVQAFVLTQSPWRPLASSTLNPNWLNARAGVPPPLEFPLIPKPPLNRITVFQTLKQHAASANVVSKQVSSKGKPFRITADFSVEALKARRAWSNGLYFLRDHDHQPWLLHPEKTWKGLQLPLVLFSRHKTDKIINLFGYVS